MRYKYELNIHGYIVATIETDQPLTAIGREMVNDDTVIRLEKYAKLQEVDRPEVHRSNGAQQETPA